jgi:hypothetical protein
MSNFHEKWIPAHCGIPGNDKADLFAKDVSQQQQESPSTSYNEAKMLQKQAHSKTWQRKRGDHGQDANIFFLTCMSIASCVFFPNMYRNPGPNRNLYPRP